MSQKPHQPWNKGRHVGPRQALAIDQVAKIQKNLKQKYSMHDLCLFCVAIDTMLRASDVLQIRVSDVMDSHENIVDYFHWRQKKTSGNVSPVLTKTTQIVIRLWLKESGKQASHYLFTREKPIESKPITVGFYRQLIKGWVEEIGLPSERYSAHSLRRTKAQYMYQQGVSIEVIGLLLGHNNTTSTIRYLGIDQTTAQNAAISYSILLT